MNEVSVDTLIDGVIGREGGYVHHPADKGGPTRWGVTEQVARAYGFTGRMQDYPRSSAVAVYRQVYWQRPGFEAVAKRLPALAETLFDIGVNMGPSVAGTILQRCLNALNGGGADYPDLQLDGAIGPLGLAALDTYRKRRGAQGDERLLLAVDCLRGARFIDITEGRPANEAFTYGWLGRMVEMAKSRAARAAAAR